MTYNVLGYFMMLPSIIQRVSLAAFAKIEKKAEIFNRSVEKVFGFISLFFVPLMATVAAFSPVWVRIVYGNKWVGMEQVAVFAAIPITATAYVLVLQSSLLAARSKSVLLQNVLFGSVYWIMMYLLSARLGPFAMPAANLIAIPVSFIILLTVFFRTYGPINILRPAFEFLGFFAVSAASWTLLFNGSLLFGSLVWTLIPLYLLFNHKSLLSIAKLKGRA